MKFTSDKSLPVQNCKLPGVRVVKPVAERLNCKPALTPLNSVSVEIDDVSSKTSLEAFQILVSPLNEMPQPAPRAMVALFKLNWEAPPTPVYVKSEPPLRVMLRPSARIFPVTLTVSPFAMVTSSAAAGAAGSQLVEVPHSLSPVPPLLSQVTVVARMRRILPRSEWRLSC